MKTSWRAGLCLAALLLAGCDHHNAKSQAANRAPVGDSEWTGQRPQPVDSLKGPPRATLVALPGQPIPPQAATPSVKPHPAPSPAPIQPAASPPPAPPTEVAASSTPANDSPPPASAAPSTPAPADTTNSSDLPPDASSAGAMPMPADTTSAAPGAVAASSPAPIVNEPPVPDHTEVAVIQTSLGKIVIELDEFAAPKTCKNFKELIEDGFYNNTVFHRVIPNFIIQGGDPKSKTSASDRDTYGLGSPGYTLPPEIVLKHDRGAVGMARLPDAMNPNRESNGSQFYICLVPCPSLDDQYTVFGHVIQGLDVAEKIAAQPRDARDNPLQRIEMTVSLQPKDQAVVNDSAANP